MFGSDLMDEVNYYLEKYNYRDIYIIVPSLKSETSPARILANNLSSRGINIYYNIDSDNIDDDEIMANKLVFLTIHQAKGLEYDIVILNGVSENRVPWQRRIGNTWDYEPLTEENLENGRTLLYVGVSRAKELLILIHNRKPSLFIPIIKAVNL